MEINPLNQNVSDKSSKAGPMSSSLPRDYHSAYALPRRSWISENRLLLFYLISIITGFLLISIAIFIPPAVIIQDYSTGTGSSFSIQIFSIVSSPIPWIISFGIGLAGAVLISLTDDHSFRHRLLGAALFALLFSIAFTIDMVNTTLLFNTIAPLFGYSPGYVFPWLTSPWLTLLIGLYVTITFGTISATIVLLTTYFGEFLWTSLRGPMYIDPRTRRTAVFIRGGTKGTVLSVNHKGGYIRGFARPSKWQSYDRED